MIFSVFWWYDIIWLSSILILIGFSLWYCSKSCSPVIDVSSTTREICLFSPILLFLFSDNMPTYFKMLMITFSLFVLNKCSPIFSLYFFWLYRKFKTFLRSYWFCNMFLSSLKYDISPYIWILLFNLLKKVASIMLLSSYKN